MVTESTETIHGILDSYSEGDQRIIAEAFIEDERLYKNHMTRTERDAAGRDSLTRAKKTIARLAKEKKIKPS